MKKQLLMIWLILSALLFACQEAVPTPTAEVVATSASNEVQIRLVTSSDSGYPSNSTGYPRLSDTQSGYPPALPLQPVTSGEEWHANILPPQPGLATVTGVVMSEKSGNPIVNVPVFLAQVHYEGDDGVFVLDGAFSPSTVSDSDGVFAFVDVDAGDYVLVFGNPEVNDYEIVRGDDQKARVWTADPDKILDTATITVDLEIWQ